MDTSQPNSTQLAQSQQLSQTSSASGSNGTFSTPAMDCEISPITTSDIQEASVSFDNLAIGSLKPTTSATSQTTSSSSPGNHARGLQNPFYLKTSAQKGSSSSSSSSQKQPSSKCLKRKRRSCSRDGVVRKKLTDISNISVPISRSEEDMEVQVKRIVPSYYKASVKKHNYVKSKFLGSASRYSDF